MLPKPKHCGENWSAMQPADGGRICGKCTRLIRDFSNASWAEIERVQRENNYSVCGMYAPAQLKHWGQTPAPRKFQLALPLVVATTAVALLHPAPGKVNAQSPAAQFTRRDTGEAPAPQPAAQPRSATQFMTFPGKVIDAETKQPLAGVNVLLKGSTVGTVSGHQGAFELAVEAAEADSAATLIFPFIGFSTQEVPVFPATADPVTIAMTADLTGLDVFYVVKPSLPKRVWWKMKRAVAPRRER